MSIQAPIANGKTSSVVKHFNLNTYQVFVKNWDDKSTPVLCAKIGSEADWNQWISPAAIMGKHKPYQPKKGFFDSNQLILISKVSTQIDSLQFEDQKYHPGQKNLRIEYYEKKKPSNASAAQFKTTLMLLLDKRNISEKVETIEIFEKSGDSVRRVCQIN